MGKHLELQPYFEVSVTGIQMDNLKQQSDLFTMFLSSAAVDTQADCAGGQTLGNINLSLRSLVWTGYQKNRKCIPV